MAKKKEEEGNPHFRGLANLVNFQARWLELSPEYRAKFPQLEELAMLRNPPPLKFYYIPEHPELTRRSRTPLRWAYVYQSTYVFEWADKDRQPESKKGVGWSSKGRAEVERKAARQLDYMRERPYHKNPTCEMFEVREGMGPGRMKSRQLKQREEELRRQEALAEKRGMSWNDWAAERLSRVKS